MAASGKTNSYIETSTAGNLTSPSQQPDVASDITFLVEDKKIHVHKTVLSLYSPVFCRMFYSEFREKEATEIPLPGKKFKYVEPFLLQMYPVHSLKPITDEFLVEVLALADEYQVEHIRLKCEECIGSQLSAALTLSTDQILLYLWVCEQHQLKQHRDTLLNLAAKKSVGDLESSQYYTSVPATALRDVMRRRCIQLENENYQLRSENEKLQKNLVFETRRTESAQRQIKSLRESNRRH